MHGRKVGIVGAGFVGATAAYTLAMLGTCHEIILYDIATNLALGKAIDIGQSTNYSPKGTIISAATKPQEIKDCDIVVITAGVPRKPGMSREDLLNTNAKIIDSVTKDIMEFSPNSIIICVSNPLDVMTYLIHKITGWKRERIIGMAGALDSARMAYQIHRKVGFGTGQVKAMVLGDHGANMIPYPHISNVGGIPLTQLLSNEDMEEIIQKTKEGGAEIVAHLGTSAYFAPARAISIMVEAILDDSRVVIPSSVMLNGEYGYHDITVGVPVVLGSKGVHQIVELDLDEEIKSKLSKSIESIKDNIQILKKSGYL